MSRKPQQQGPTIIESAYGFGEIMPLPSRPEPARVAPVYLDPTGVQKLFGWSATQYDRALNSPLQSPVAVARRTNKTGSSSVPVWSRDALLAWRDRILDEVKALDL